MEGKVRLVEVGKKVMIQACGSVLAGWDVMGGGVMGVVGEVSNDDA